MNGLAAATIVVVALVLGVVLVVYIRSYTDNRRAERVHELDVERMRYAHLERLETKVIAELGKQILGTPRPGEPEPAYELAPPGPGTGQEPFAGFDDWTAQDPTDAIEPDPDDPIPAGEYPSV